MANIVKYERNNHKVLYNIIRIKEVIIWKIKRQCTLNTLVTT
jgi:hypothetical protein